MGRRTIERNFSGTLIAPVIAELKRQHLYPITHVDQGLELLTGVPAGTVETPGSLHSLVQARLQRLAQDILAFVDGRQNGARPAKVSQTSAAPMR